MISCIAVRFMRSTLALFFWYTASILSVFGQTGISVSTPRLYYEVSPGNTGNSSFIITNESKTNTLEMSMSIGDWGYDPSGRNLFYDAGTTANSCAAWINTDAGSQFTLAPGESKTVNVTLSVPSDINVNIPVHTSMLYVTQMNPIDNKITLVKESVRVGLKLFHRLPGPKLFQTTITNLAYAKDKNALLVAVENNSNIWVEGTIYTELFNTTTGKKLKLPDASLYSLPGDRRTIYLPIENSLEEGKYTATVIVDNGDKENLEVAELTFSHE